MTTDQREAHGHDFISDPSDVPAGAIIIGVDASVSDNVLAWAIDQAEAERRPLVLAHAGGPAWAEQTVWDRDRLRADLLGSGEEALDHARQLVHGRADPDLRLERFVAIADPADLLVELSARASLVVLGSHGRGPVGRVLMGSVGVTVTRRAMCPVLVHRPTSQGVVRHGVLVGIDATEHSRATLKVAFRVASARHLPLTVLHTRGEADPEASIIPPRLVAGDALTDLADDRLQVAESIAGLREDHPDVYTTIQIARGRPEKSLLHLAPRMDLLVVGRHHARHGSVLSGTATSVLEHGTCPVMVVPATGTSR